MNDTPVVGKIENLGPAPQKVKIIPSGVPIAKGKLIGDWQKYIHDWAKRKGWWDSPRATGDIFANFHAEISEAWEEYRNGKGMNEIYEKDGKPEGVPIELADAIIRIMDFAEANGIDLDAAIDQKMAYNEKRPYRHGNKLA